MVQTTPTPSTETDNRSCRLHDEQGHFSQTYIVKLEDQSNLIVQFRDTPLDFSLYELARRTFFFRQNMHLSVT